MEQISLVPVVAVFIPLLGSFPLYIIGKKSEKLRNIGAVAISIAAFLLVASMYPEIERGAKITYELPILMITGVKFSADATGFLFALVTSFVWMLATIYSTVYMSHEHARDRYFAFFILTLAADLGVLLTADLFSLFIFFELLGLSSWVLVIHTQTPEAMRAGKKYLFMTILGGLSLLFGIFLVYIYTGTLEIAPLMERLSPLGNMRYVIAASMILGFGVKAGMFPVHVWLPEAHPIAPSPASALLSGVMVKTGIYGIIRTLLIVFSPAEKHEMWNATSPMGYWMIWIALVTMFMGALLAILQDNMKRMMAYSTISQIGYMLFGIGIAAYLGYEGALGLAGAIYHFVNHALFKSLFFLVAGAVYFRTHELDMNRLGGLWHKMPYTTLAFVIAFLGIGGIPLFNGYASKLLLFEGIVEAGEHSAFLNIAKVMFVVTSGGTIAYYLKMFALAFFGKGEGKEIKEAPLLMLLPMYAIALSILAIGLFPELLLSRAIVPALESYTFDFSSAEHIAETRFFTMPAIQEVGVAMLFSSVFFAIGMKEQLFRIQLPRKIGVDYWYETAAAHLLWLARGPFTTIDRVINSGYVGGSKKFLKTAKAALELDRKIDKGYVDTGKKLIKSAVPALELDKKIDRGYVDTGKKLMEAAQPAARFDTVIDKGYVDTGKKLMDVAQPAARFDKVIDRGYVKGGEEFAKYGYPRPPAIHEAEVSLMRGEIFINYGNYLAEFDLRVVDGIVNGIGRLGLRTARTSGSFDLAVVDGVVNGIGDTLKEAGKKLREPETGYIQDYASAVILGAIILMLITIFM